MTTRGCVHLQGMCLVARGTDSATVVVKEQGGTTACAVTDDLRREGSRELEAASGMPEPNLHLPTCGGGQTCVKVSRQEWLGGWKTFWKSPTSSVLCSDHHHHQPAGFLHRSRPAPDLTQEQQQWWCRLLRRFSPGPERVCMGGSRERGLGICLSGPAYRCST